MKHYCRWLKSEKGGTLGCWQKGKFKACECNACLSARIVQAVTPLKAKRKPESPVLSGK